MRPRRLHAPTWTFALETVLDVFLLVGGRNPPITDEQDRIMTELFLICDALRTRRHRHAEGTNRELAAKYGTCERNVRNWRREGCPFEEGKWHVLKWLAGRRYVPAGTKAQFGERLKDLKWRALLAQGPVILASMRHVKWLYREHGMQPEDWMRNFRAKPGKLDFCGYGTPKERKAKSQKGHSPSGNP